MPKVTPEEAAKLCDRNFGIGADGVIFVLPGVNGADYTMRTFNSDGSEPEVSRCFITSLNNVGPSEMSYGLSGIMFISVMTILCCDIFADMHIVS